MRLAGFDGVGLLFVVGYDCGVFVVACCYCVLYC